MFNMYIEHLHSMYKTILDLCCLNPLYLCIGFNILCLPNPIHPCNHMHVLIFPPSLCAPTICTYAHAHVHAHKARSTRHHAMSPPWLHANHLPRLPLAYPPCALVVPPRLFNMSHPFIMCLFWEEIFDM